MEQLKKKVRIVPMTNEYLEDVSDLERECFSNPWSRNMLAEELENACSAFLVALDAETNSVVGYAGLLAVAECCVENFDFFHVKYLLDCERYRYTDKTKRPSSLYFKRRKS